jgi:hypothetical protein
MCDGSFRLPNMSAGTKPATPALTWITVPPAKSSSPRLFNKPTPDKPYQRGIYRQHPQG